MSRALSLSLLFLLFALPIAKAQSVTPRITGAVDNEKRVTLRGNTYPLARPEYDRGVAPDSLPMERMLLVLTRSAEQEAALTTLLDEQQDKSSPNFHKWLTPEKFGQQFGPADADIRAVTGWLTSRGFRVNNVAKGRTVIEFSGDAGLLRNAFHTQIHKYVVNGEEHWANANDPQIPAALAPVVGGIDSLNDFPRRPMHHVVGTFSRSKATGEVKQVSPEFTFPGTGCNPSGFCYALGPYDFATIYNVLPLWNAGIDGTGQNIAIVALSDINVQDVRNFRSLFGLPAKDPKVIVNGAPPVTPDVDAEGEADLDVQWSGAVAKNATINLVVSASTNPTSGADLSAAYIVDNNLAPVMSMSLGLCELFLGRGGNQTYGQLWQQASAQGITVLVAAGDQGSAGCDLKPDPILNPPPAPALFGLEVNGIASTPFDIAVGGTDFNDLTDATTFWNPTNSSTTHASAKGYIPETTWNSSCTNADFGLNPEANCNALNLSNFVLTSGGGGGASNCTTSDGQNAASCAGGYSKPSWQRGLGTPDNRDVPDVSLFASNGFTGSFYIVCQEDADPDKSGAQCDLNNPFMHFVGVGGTSASSPAFAAIMAMVNQKTGSRQGNANYVFYKMAAQSGASCTSSATPGTSCIFYDVTEGTNAMPCLFNISPNCNASNTADIYGILSGFNATAGYDLATGLGSVNAANLVNNWSAARSAPSTIALTLNPTNVTQSTAVSVNITVSGADAGTPTGDVGLIANTGANGGQTGVTLANFTLSGGSLSTTTTSTLPAGSYTVVAHYEGDGTFLPSDSTPVQITVTGGAGTGFSVSPNPASLSIAAPGQSGTSTITVTGTNGFTGTVSFACSVSPLPANDPPTCFANPSSIALSATTTTATANLRISTTAGLNSGLRAEKVPKKPGYFAASMGLVLACIFMLGVPRQRKHWAASLGLIVLVFLGVALSSCASGSGGSSRINFGTPAGSYTVTFTASGGGTTQTTNVAVTVQ